RAMVRLKMKNRGGLVRFSPDDFYRDVTEDEERRHGEKRQWGTAEQEAVHNIFFENISTGNLPGKAEILEAQRVEPSLGRRSWQNVKDYIRNAITRNSKKLKR
ncbi:hypothetical protein BaRGS_00040262, partial [Batillaria attramentaria]